jgi:hypothetical protein
LNILKGQDQFGDVEVVGRIVLKCIVKTFDVKM